MKNEECTFHHKQRLKAKSSISFSLFIDIYVKYITVHYRQTIQKAV